MIPILYEQDRTSFEDNNGIGALSDSKTCKSEEILNGGYEISLELPIDGKFVSSVVANRIIKVKPNYRDEPQPFRIYSVEKNIDGIVKVKAAHLSYDTEGIPVLPFISETLKDAVDNMNMNRNTRNDSLFTLSTNFEAEGDLKVDKPSSFRSLLGGSDDTITGVYGGEYHYDKYSIQLLQQRGVDQGICFRSGKNLIEFEQETNCEKTYSSILGYWKSNGDSPTYVYSDIYTIDNGYKYEKIQILEVTSEQLAIGSSSTPTVDQMNEYVENYISDNDIGAFKYSMSVTYSDDEQVTKLCVGDTVKVLIPEYNIKFTARCSKIVFDCLLERNESVELGNVNEGIVGEVAILSED